MRQQGLLLTARNISVSFGAEPVLDRTGFSIEPGERVCLLGRNGAGKSTLMKVIAGEIRPDEGELLLKPGARVARLPQELPRNYPGTVYDLVSDGLGELGRLLGRYHQLSAAVADSDSTAAVLSDMERVQQQLEALDGWTMHQRVDAALSRLALPGDMPVQQASGGVGRRTLLAQALVQQPDLLLLDEPTNHLDVDAIRQMEELLLDWNGALLFITHDRAFLQRLATRIVELDRGTLRSYPGDYQRYQQTREDELAAEEKAQQQFQRELAREETWIRQGIKARRTRNEGRVRALQAMRRENAARRERQGNASFDLQNAERSGRLVIRAEDIHHGFGGAPLVAGFSTTIMRGDKVGLIGPNGSGKTTLLNILLGRMTPNAGQVRLGTNLEVAYFDQLREQLDDSRSVAENVSGGSENVTVNGQSRHIMSYLRDFLFTPEQARGPITALSGGERNRLLLARLFTCPANLLVLDEPTNDLDMETLELLEQLLVDFQGTVLLVSHDRAFLDNVVGSSLVFEGEGKVREYVGGYSDWVRQRPQAAESQPKPARAAAPSAVPTKPTQTPARAKLSYKDKRELEQLPAVIERLEAEQESLSATLADPAFYQQASDAIQQTTERLAAVEAELERAFERWAELEQP
ncbi:MAG: ATP-binding cassette domain-containing protein [Ectothiorhodospiraceae bacterium]|nr:ATP-binding cassette domain-containing protein [Ectothiorhodospiraceae bacterium]